VVQVLGLQAGDDLPREGDRRLRVARQQRLELRLVQPRQHRVADRHHGGRARLAGVKAHLADHLAAAKFAHHPLAAVVAAHVDAEAAADRQVGRVAGRALRHQHLAGADLDPLHVLAQEGDRLRAQLAEQRPKVARQQRLAVRPACGRTGHRSPLPF
jgi:hypothetical protein